MVVKVYRVVRRSSEELLLDIIRRLCDKCEGVVVHSLPDNVEIECTGELAMGFCDNCRIASPPQGVEPGDAVPLIDYFCWIFICEPEYLRVALADHQQLVEEVLMEKMLVTVKNSVTKKIWLVSFASHLDALFMPGASALSFPKLPYMLYYEDDRLLTIPLEHVFIYYPAKK